MGGKQKAPATPKGPAGTPKRAQSSKKAQVPPSKPPLTPKPPSTPKSATPRQQRKPTFYEPAPPAEPKETPRKPTSDAPSTPRTPQPTPKSSKTKSAVKKDAARGSTPGATTQEKNDIVSSSRKAKSQHAVATKTPEPTSAEVNERNAVGKKNNEKKAKKAEEAPKPAECIVIDDNDDDSSSSSSSGDEPIFVGIQPSPRRNRRSQIRQPKSPILPRSSDSSDSEGSDQEVTFIKEEPKVKMEPGTPVRPLSIKGYNIEADTPKTKQEAPWSSQRYNLRTLKEIKRETGSNNGSPTKLGSRLTTPSNKVQNSAGSVITSQQDRDVFVRPDHSRYDLRKTTPSQGRSSRLFTDQARESSGGDSPMTPNELLAIKKEDAKKQPRPASSKSQSSRLQVGDAEGRQAPNHPLPWRPPPYIGPAQHQSRSKGQKQPAYRPANMHRHDDASDSSVDMPPDGANPTSSTAPQLRGGPSDDHYAGPESEEETLDVRKPQIEGGAGDIHNVAAFTLEERRAPDATTLLSTSNNPRRRTTSSAATNPTRPKARVTASSSEVRHAHGANKRVRSPEFEAAAKRQKVNHPEALSGKSEAPRQPTPLSPRLLPLAPASLSAPNDLKLDCTSTTADRPPESFGVNDRRPLKAVLTKRVWKMKDYEVYTPYTPLAKKLMKLVMRLDRKEMRRMQKELQRKS